MITAAVSLQEAHIDAPAMIPRQQKCVNCILKIFQRDNAGDNLHMGSMTCDRREPKGTPVRKIILETFLSKACKAHMQTG